MPKITIKDTTIDSEGAEPYVVAEIGCNHCGDFEMCIEMVRRAAECGVDAVKLQKRNNRELFTAAALAEPYHSQNAYGATYGEHREVLDWFGYREFVVVSELCAELGVAFIATPFTLSDADFLMRGGIRLDAFKIASCDLANLPLIEHVAVTGKPLIISTGGGTQTDILRALESARHVTRCAVLHCVSLYPNTDGCLDLAVIAENSALLDAVYGFSSHHPGILPHILAYTQGARIFEAHFTLNRGLKGTDHGFSLEPAGLRQLCEDLQRIPVMVGGNQHIVTTEESTGFVRKMGKSIYAARPIAAGGIIERGALYLRAPAVGEAPHTIEDYIGLRARVDIEPDALISNDMFQAASADVEQRAPLYGMIGE